MMAPPRELPLSRRPITIVHVYTLHRHGPGLRLTTQLALGPSPWWAQPRAVVVTDCQDDEPARPWTPCIIVPEHRADVSLRAEYEDEGGQCGLIKARRVAIGIPSATVTVGPAHRTEIRRRSPL